MSEGFFSDLAFTDQKEQPYLVPQCGACGLFKTCNSPKMGVTGKGNKRILILGEYPGGFEDKQNKLFIGESFNLLKRALQKNGVDLFHDCWLYNSVICAPPRRSATSQEVNYCRPNVIKVIQELNPVTIIPMGSLATHSLIGWLWKKDPGPINRWSGFQIPCQKLNCWICPTFHPVYCSKQDDPALSLWFNKHIQQALKKKKRPWSIVPDYDSMIKLVYDVDEAVSEIETLVKTGKPLAFDYENNCLKPDGRESSIVCCSVSDGETAIAYPWTEPAIAATRRMVRSPNPKIASNCKHEDRWTWALLKTRVRNWKWDTMLAAHVIDNRKAITSLKFQAWVMLGAESYDDSIKSYLHGKGGYGTNRVNDIKINKLLKYCALDSLLEVLVARKQAKYLGMELT